ncbi:Holliday junction branch migration protein RuvA [Clostridioides difficile]|uniref:Holliday junction branch migration protein RuvA n=1 Tax=Clostridioides difficile TaxID=1496 RepID=UPI0002DF3A1F|nr:Holliday junction branch migration protein RuvA [Clostridioides difficile]AXU51074.1 Holliday junction DNA helicase RuvA [Clostridioides difficile]AXU65549.1 Holliday junction DNA helicase RuvA [Clostridioides difficile]EGT3680964.1 Holliday junction branch migration protein RuvA [Clostridioides difficile]EGT3807184.1 Holliday junction branch migration protein RuvA [Clostridioides difficile]EGT3864843.1 Holliday junction branch migration protein RuvA [Clostridioides difficile]
MYSYIKGTVEEIYIDSIVVENNGIGYKINVSSNTIMNLQVGESTKIYTKLIVREDDMSLCGFVSREELKMFELLTSVSKIGPKVALSILSFASPAQLGAYILSEDIGKLSKAPGVGKKTAERIVLELKDKVDKNNIEFEPTLLSQKPTLISQDESVDALVALGYTLSESKEAVQKCKKDGMNTEAIIKKALTYIMSKSLK